MGEDIIEDTVEKQRRVVVETAEKDQAISGKDRCQEATPSLAFQPHLYFDFLQQSWLPQFMVT